MHGCTMELSFSFWHHSCLCVSVCLFLFIQIRWKYLSALLFKHSEYIQHNVTPKPGATTPFYKYMFQAPNKYFSSSKSISLNGIKRQIKERKIHHYSLRHSLIVAACTDSWSLFSVYKLTRLLNLSLLEATLGYQPFPAPNNFYSVGP